MAYGGAGSNIKLLSLTDANAWRDVLGWDINANGEIDGMTAYSAVGWVNRCVHLRAATLASLPWSLRKGDSEIASSEDEDYTALPWLEMLPDLLYLAESALCIVGCAYLGKVRTRGKRLESLRWFAPPTMTPLWSATDGLVGYERKIGSAVKGQPWRVDDVVYFRTPNPMHETEPGPSPVATALIDAQVIYSLNQYSSLFFQRGAIKPTLLTVEGNPIPAERERLKAWWQRAFSGVKNAFNTEVVSANVKPIVVGEGIAELNNADLTAEKREAISTALGVPHSLVMSNAANFAVSESDRLNLYDTTVIPEAKFVANQLNRQLFNEFGYRLVFKPETLALFQEDEEQRATALTQFVNAGMKLSVAAEILGIQLPDGMEYADLDEQPEPQTITVVAQPRQIEDSQRDEPVAVSQERTVEAAKFRKWLKRRPDADLHEFKTAILSHDDLHDIAEEVRGVATEQPFFTLPQTFTRESVAAIKAMILQLDPSDDEAEQKIRMELEKRSARAIDKAFTEMVNTLYPEGYGSTGAFIDPNLEAGRIHRAFVEDQKLRDAVARALIDGSDLGVSVAIDQMENVGLAFDWTLAHTAARDWATRYTDDLLNQMGTTSGRLVGQAVGRWFNNGEPLEKLIGDLEPAFGRRRAERIAATEVTRAAFEGSRAGYRESGVIQKMVWRTSRDERVCPICGPMEGRYAGLDGVWDGNVRIPAHPNCRCWVSPVVEMTQGAIAQNAVEPARLSPNGIKPSASVTSRTTMNKKGVESALSAIDRSHGDGSLSDIKVKDVKIRNSGIGGQFNYGTPGTRNIEFNVNANETVKGFTESTFVHEFGHAIDVDMLKLNKVFRDNAIHGTELPPHIKAWNDAVKKSKNYARLKDLKSGKELIPDIVVNGKAGHYVVDKKYLTYLMRDDELWARSYAQFVAKRGGSELLKRQVDELFKVGTYPMQWGDDDFVEIEKAIEGVFVALGWLK